MDEIEETVGELQLNDLTANQLLAKIDEMLEKEPDATHVDVSFRNNWGEVKVMRMFPAEEYEDDSPSVH